MASYSIAAAKTPCLDERLCRTEISPAAIGNWFAFHVTKHAPGGPGLEVRFRTAR
jgi:hypothetical protein